MQLSVTKSQQHFSLLLWVALGILGRIVPHLQNVSPLMTLTILAASVFSRRVAYLQIIISLVISDVLLAVIFHYPVFGAWTCFTYSGFLAAAFLGSRLSLGSKTTTFFVTVLGSSLGYWAWTNFGVWVAGNYYSHTAVGLAACFAAGLPFLKYSLCGTMAWLVVLLGSLRFMKRRREMMSVS